jgi:aminoglycoside phosphotransferase family enzyme/predicted kinase
VESLLKPSAYPVESRTVSLIQTHVSWLFLTDTHVFKLKKPVAFDFVDFSTVELRRFYCHEELRLNRRLCPEIYEQVIALRETETGAAFGGNGKVIDYAVMMKRLPAERMLDRLVDSGSVSTAEIQLIARMIATFHSHAPTSPHISTFGTLEQIQFNWQENFHQTLQFEDSTLPQNVRETIRTCVDTWISSQHDLFTGRISNGFIRECDGDIHLGNICLTNSTAYIFDCIEFNERFRCSDTAADIAFLLMDLEYHRRPDLADAALSTYLEISGDTECARLMPFYQTYRAFVRGKVESFTLRDPGISGELRDEAEQRAVRYFRLAQGYCLRQRLPQTLYITCGTMGCGKSTLAEQLACELGLKIFNSDRVRKQMAGLTPETAAAAPFGEGLYAAEMSRQTYLSLMQSADRELAAGHSVIIDAGFGTQELRSECARLAATHRAAFVIVFVQCDSPEQRRRLRERSSQGGSISDGREELLDLQTQRFEPPDQAEGTLIRCSSNSSGAHDVNATLQGIIENLQKESEADSTASRNHLTVDRLNLPSISQGAGIVQ